jgi:hypothetical protein
MVILAVSALAAGCLEYDLTDEVPQWPDSRAPSLEDPVQEDRILQVTTPKVDILWTIDNSCSMQDEQDALTLNFPIFMDYFLGSGLDYHVGVVSTDLDNNSHYGKLRTAAGVKWVDPDTPNPVQVFASMAGMGISGSGIERGLGATFLALEQHKDTFNDGFYRDEASIHTVVISDERDQTKTSMITKGEFIDWYDGLKANTDDRTFSSIVTMQGPDKGTAYLDVTADIGGITWDIENEDWVEVLDQLGVQASGLKREYFLSQLPVDGTITVSVEDKGNTFNFFENEDWLYDEARNSITFIEYVPDALAEVYIRYTILASSQDQEMLEEPPQ